MLVGLIVYFRIVESLHRAADEKQAERRLLVNMTLLPHASSIGAVCLDGSPPAYHLDRGFGPADSNWLLQFELERKASSLHGAHRALRLPKSHATDK